MTAEFDIANFESGMTGCDAVFPFDPQQAYDGARRRDE